MSKFANARPLAMAGGLIALYLIVRNPGAMSTFLTQGPQGATGVIKAFQGR